MSSQIALKRIMTEFEQLKNSDDSLFTITSKNENAFLYQAYVYGPPDTPYYGYRYELEITLPVNYPINAPSVKFVTPIQHLNVNSHGDICIDILKAGEWRPMYTIRNILMAIYSLLISPNANDAFNPDLAKIYNDNITTYREIIHNSCAKFAEKVKK